MSKTPAEYKIEVEAEAEVLAAEGRAGRGMAIDWMTRETIERSIIRRAFWNLEQHKRFPANPDERLSDDAHLTLLIRYTVRDAIESEHDRIAAIMRKALLEITGNDDDDALY